VSSNLILSFIVALALSVAGSSLARAESNSSNEAGAQTTDSQTTKPKKTKKTKKHPNKTELDKAERGNPHSVIYKSGRRAPQPVERADPSGRDGSPGQRG